MKEIKFYKAWWYIEDLCAKNADNVYKKNKQLVSDQADRAIDIQVAKVNPTTSRIDDDEKLNTKVEIWLEFGFWEWNKGLKTIMHTHDIRCDCGGDTFEEAVIELAKLIKKYYI